jgi:DNA-directed RNA polymerase I, II, and III subunit RPABC2
MADEIEDEYEEETFFNSTSYDNFIKKNGIEFLDDKNFVNTNTHKEDIIVPKDMRITSEIMTMAEFTRIVSERAKQIENGGPIFCPINNETDPIKIAELEIAMKQCPMVITRYLTHNIAERWSVNEMVTPFK